MLEIIGYFSSVIIGITLGLMGGGGSILTVPLLVYIFELNPITATSYSLFIVGITSLMGSAAYMKKKLISFKTFLAFALPALTAVLFTRKFIVPFLPDVIFSIGSYSVSKDVFIMILFALLMLAASVSMIKGKRDNDTSGYFKINLSVLIPEGIAVGFLTGLVGAGGGFLIIPSLIVFANLNMKTAVGTSLLIIAVNSLIGFGGDVSTNMVINWQFLFVISMLAVIGIFIGSYLSKFIPGSKLKPAFGWFVLVMGIYILAKEIIIKI